MKIEAMPILMASRYTPEIVESEESRRSFLETRRDSAVLVLKTSVYSLYTCKDSGKRIWYYAVADNDLIYLMHLNPLILIREDGVRNKSVYQGSVWRSPESAMFNIRNLPSAVFWSLLKPGTALISDSMQSADGQTFWMRRISEALEKGLIVEAISLRPGDEHYVRKVIPIVRGDKILKYWTFESKGDDRGMYWRFCIRKP